MKTESVLSKRRACCWSYVNDTSEVFTHLL